MTTRRRAMGAILGGVAAGPQAIRQVAAASANANRVSGGMPSPSAPYLGFLSQPAPNSGHVARLRRIAAGDVDLDELQRWGAYKISADKEHLDALQSMSPMVRNVLLATRTEKRCKTAAIKSAIQELISMGLK